MPILVEILARKCFSLEQFVMCGDFFHIAVFLLHICGTLPERVSTLQSVKAPKILILGLEKVQTFGLVI